MNYLLIIIINYKHPLIILKRWHVDISTPISKHPNESEKNEKKINKKMLNMLKLSKLPNSRFDKKAQNIRQNSAKHRQNSK